jgi:histone H3/H4
MGDTGDGSAAGQAGVDTEWQIARIVSRIVPDDTELTDQAVSLMRRLMEQHMRILVQTATEDAMHARSGKVLPSDVVGALKKIDHRRSHELMKNYSLKVSNSLKAQTVKKNGGKFHMEATVWGVAVPELRPSDARTEGPPAKKVKVEPAHSSSSSS